MKVCLSEIYDKLEAWRGERKITAESQKEGYIINIMEEFGELAAALRDYERFSKPSYPYPKNKKYAEHGIIDALCDIAILTINAGVHIPCELKRTEMEWKKSSLNADYILKQMVENCAEFSYFDWGEEKCFNIILVNCAYLCEQYGFNFEIAMLEHIKQISSNTGKEYKANYEKARIVNVKDKK